MKRSSKLNFHFWAMAAHGQGISGGDRIFIELAKQLSRDHMVKIILWEEGLRMCRRQHLKEKNIHYQILKMEPWSKLGFATNYLARIIKSLILASKMSLSNNPETIIYSASDFWMDCLPCLVLKLRFPKIKWMAAWLQTAPNPIKGFTEGERKKAYRFNAAILWLTQLPIRPLISRFSDLVIVNNEEERKYFPGLNKKGKVIVLLGGVNLEEIKKWRLKFSHLPKIYDAVFQGRFHPQKGVVELIDIWEKVIRRKPEAKLAMIGDGPLFEQVKKKIKHLGLEKNIKLFGYVFDGPKKYQIFSQSKIVVHPSFYDSGGMAAAEAMAFGLPAVGFRLKSYESYYPQGMIKAKVGGLENFSSLAYHLITNISYRCKIAKDAVRMIERSWSWDIRAKEILEKITNE